MERCLPTMIVGYVETSGEAPDLARAETIAAAEALGGGPARAVRPFGGLVEVEIPDLRALEALAHRLALARRCLLLAGEGSPPSAAIPSVARAGGSASFRRVGGSPGRADDGVREAGRLYRAAGGTIDLDAPERRFWLGSDSRGAEAVFLEVAPIDRPQSAARRMPLLPFQRPIALAPRLARAAANLARVAPGDRVLDPFLGTGALLAEAALLGGRAFGIDRDPEMVVGALRNFAHLGVEAAEIVGGDAGSVQFRDPEQRFEAILTDAPYGRSSGAGGEELPALLGRVVPRWADRIEPGGRVVLVVPTGTPPLDAPWHESLSVGVRVHRSLTREFRVYERGR